MTAIAEQTLCARCGHVKSIHADGMNDCLAYHELADHGFGDAEMRPCDCPAFVAPFNDLPPAA